MCDSRATKRFNGTAPLTRKQHLGRDRGPAYDRKSKSVWYALWP